MRRPYGVYAVLGRLKGVNDYSPPPRRHRYRFTCPPTEISLDKELMNLYNIYPT